LYDDRTFGDFPDSEHSDARYLAAWRAINGHVLFFLENKLAARLLATSGTLRISGLDEPEDRQGLRLMKYSNE